MLASHPPKSTGAPGTGVLKSSRKWVAGALVAAAALAGGGCGSQALQARTPPTSVGAGERTVLFTCAGRPKVAPKSLLLACGDGGNALVDLVWSHWGEAAASAAGRERILTCKPDCVSGATRSYPVRVTARQLLLASASAPAKATYGMLLIRKAAAAPHAKPTVFAMGSFGPALAAAIYGGAKSRKLANGTTVMVGPSGRLGEPTAKARGSS